MTDLNGGRDVRTPYLESEGYYPALVRHLNTCRLYQFPEDRYEHMEFTGELGPAAVNPEHSFITRNPHVRD